jgi:hypothetical protein
MSTFAGPDEHKYPALHFGSTSTKVNVVRGYEHAGIATETVITPPFPVIVEPAGSGGAPALRVKLILGAALVAPPIYLNVVVQPVWYVPEQLAVDFTKAIWRKTKIEVGTPAAPPAASSTRTTKAKVPATVGLPVALPFEDRVTPAGSRPDEIDHLYGLTPPAATKVTAP